MIHGGLVAIAHHQAVDLDSGIGGGHPQILGIRAAPPYSAPMGTRSRTTLASADDRDRAVGLLNNAYALGELDEQLRDRRVGSALVAVSLTDLAALTADLQSVPDDAFRDPSRRRMGRWRRPANGGAKGWWVPTLLGAGGLVVALTLAGVALSSEDSQGPPPPVLTSSGLTEFFADLQSTTHSSKVYALATAGTWGCAATPGGAVSGSGVPVTGYQFSDGELTEDADVGAVAAGTPVVDLARVDVSRLMANVDRAVRDVGTGAEVRVTISGGHHVSCGHEPTWLTDFPQGSARVTIEASEGTRRSWLVTDLAGTADYLHTQNTPTT